MDSHRHKTEAIAAKCIEDRIKRLGPNAIRELKMKTLPTQGLMFHMKQEAKTYADIRREIETLQAKLANAESARARALADIRKQAAEWGFEVIDPDQAVEEQAAEPPSKPAKPAKKQREQQQAKPKAHKSALPPPTTKNGGRAPPKYISPDGKYVWSGRGRNTPSWIKEYEMQGGDRANLLIDKSLLSSTT